MNRREFLKSLGVAGAVAVAPIIATNGAVAAEFKGIIGPKVLWTEAWFDFDHMYGLAGWFPNGWGMANRMIIWPSDPDLGKFKEEMKRSMYYWWEKKGQWKPFDKEGAEEYKVWLKMTELRDSGKYTLDEIAQAFDKEPYNVSQFTL